MLVGMGAVSTTTIAGVLAIRRGLAKPIGSLTQMGTVRLGKRTEGRSPLIKDFVPLASLDDIVFGGWDIFEDNSYEAAKTAGVLEKDLLEQIRPELEPIKPWSAVFDRHYVKRLDGPNVKKGKNKRELAEPAPRGHAALQAGAWPRPPGDGVVRQHRDLPDRIAGARQRRGVREGARGERSRDPVEHGLRVRGDQGRHPVRERRAEPER